MKKIYNQPLKVAGLSPQKGYIAPGGEIEYLEPLGLEYVLGVARDKNCEVELFTMYKETENEVIKKIVAFQPDVLAVSCMTPQFKTGLRMAKKIKERLPKIKIVFGGYHPSTFPNIVKNKIVDFCVIGEGEKTFDELLDCLINEDKNYERINGLSFMKKDELVITKARTRTENLDEFPEPFRVDFLKELRNCGLVYPPITKQTGFASLDCSRGCLFNCDFCASPKVLGRQVTNKSATRIIKELKKLNLEQSINTFFFTDLNFTANKEWATAICDAIIESGLKIYWECMSNIITADDEKLLKKMYDAGCRKIAWGIESVSDDILKKMKKPLSARMDYQVLKKAESVGILNTGFCIIGEPSETKEQIMTYPEKLNELPLHRIRVGLYTPLPGSMLYERTKKSLSKNTDLFDTEHIIFKHPNFEKGELEILKSDLTNAFYENEDYQKRIKILIDKFPEYDEVFREYFGTLKKIN